MVLPDAQSPIDSRYLRVMCSPYLSEEIHGLCQRFLSPDDVTEYWERLVKLAEGRATIEIVRESLGVTASGRALIGWSIRRPDQVKRPIILSASQHHGPENIGASVALYFSHLLLEDARLHDLLDRYQFTFFPQQNPDALEFRGNLKWMRAPHNLVSLINHYQYDPRSIDVEHGVPRQCLSGLGAHDSSQFKRAETQALVTWVEEKLANGDTISTYLSGHAWDVLNQPLFLLSGAPAANTHKRAWVQRMLGWIEVAPFDLNPSPPLSSDYVLQAPDLCHSDPNPGEADPDLKLYSGVYKAPHFDDFQSLNEQSAVMYSTLAYVEARVPEAVVVVLEPPIVDSAYFKEDSEGHEAQRLSELRARFLKACLRHDFLVKSMTQSAGWRPEVPRAQLEKQLLAHGGGGAESFLARIILEVFEQSEVYGVWERFFRSIDAGQIKVSLTPSQLLVAMASQQFATANLASQILRLHNDDPQASLLKGVKLSDIREVYQEAADYLGQLELELFDPRQASFVYISALLAAADVDCPVHSKD